MSLGNILRNAREKKGLSPNDVAEQTNMMVQIIEELENEDFHRIAAPIYGRGFLKLYAELLEIDVTPLVQEFMDIYTGKVTPELRKRDMGLVPAPENKDIEIEPELVFQEPSEKIPLRVEVTPAPSAATLAAPPKRELAPIVEAIENEPSEAPAVENVVKQAVPEVSNGLFDSEEPNLFNTTPLQQRIAEARKLMEGKGSEEKETKPALHLSTNQKLPIFQIGGRMDQTYDTELRGIKPISSIKRPLGGGWTGFNRFVDQLSGRMPFDLSKKSFYIFGLLGVIVIALMTVGITALFKLTAADKKSAGDEVVTVEKILAEPLQTKTLEVDDKVPPPPDMYFD